MSTFCGVVLAGGASRRMGVDKGSLPAVAGRVGDTILERVIRTMQDVCTDIFVLQAAAAVNTPELPPRGPGGGGQNVRIVRDVQPFQGPLAALVDAWSLFAAYDAVLLAPADVPGLTAQVLQCCRDRYETAQRQAVAVGATPQGVLVVRERRLQGLLGVYDSAAGDVFRLARQQGETRLMKAVTALPLAFVDTSAEGWPDWWTRPVHTPDDYQQWLQEVLSHETGSPD